MACDLVALQATSEPSVGTSDVATAHLASLCHPLLVSECALEGPVSQAWTHLPVSPRGSEMGLGQGGLLLPGWQDTQIAHQGVHVVGTQICRWVMLVTMVITYIH